MNKEKETLAANIMELNRELFANQQKTKLYESSGIMARKNIERGKITLKEIDSLTENHKVYSSLGRAFLLQDKKSISNMILDQMKNSEKEILEIEKSKNIFESKSKEMETQLAEMLNQLKISN